MDIDNIEPGEDFAEVLERALDSADVLLAMIGPQWSSITDAQGNRRLDDPNDFVRLEIATALRGEIRVVPVLVGGANLPVAGELPNELDDLRRRQALEVEDTRFHTDVDRLENFLKKFFEEQTHASAEERRRRRAKKEEKQLQVAREKPGRTLKQLDRYLEKTRPAQRTGPEEAIEASWGFRALRSLIPVIAINESSDCDRPSERSDVRVWLVQFSFSGC